MKRVIDMKCLFWVTLLLMVGCTALGLPTAQTFNEKWAVSIATITEIRTSAKTLLVAKAITPDDAQDIQQQADALRSSLDVARKLHATDAPAGDAKLALASGALNALRSYLVTKGAK